MRVLASLLAGLLAGTMALVAVAWDENDRGAYNNKMALLAVLLERARSAKGGTRSSQALPVDEHCQECDRQVCGKQP